MAQNNKMVRCPQDNFLFLAIFPGHCKAKDRPQFGLKCTKVKKYSKHKEKAGVPVEVTDKNMKQNKLEHNSLGTDKMSIRLRKT